MERAALALAGQQQGLQHILGHRPGVAAGGMGEGNAQLVQGGPVHMVGADGGGADEAHRGALQQRPVDTGHRAHQQHVGVFQGVTVQGAAVDTGDGAPGLEGFQGGHVFVGDDLHSRSLWWSLPGRAQCRDSASAVDWIAPV